MAETARNPVDLEGAAHVVEMSDAVVREALAVASRRTQGGKGIDEEQVHCERLAYAATEVAAARDLLAYARAAAAGTRSSAGSRPCADR